MRVTLDIPDSLAAQLVPIDRDPARSLLEDATAAAYRMHRLTMEQVRHLLGFGTRMQVDEFLRQYEVYDYTPADLQHDMETLNRLLPAHSVA